MFFLRFLILIYLHIWSLPYRFIFTFFWLTLSFLLLLLRSSILFSSLMGRMADVYRHPICHCKSFFRIFIKFSLWFLIAPKKILLYLTPVNHRFKASIFLLFLNRNFYYIFLRVWHSYRSAKHYIIEVMVKPLLFQLGHVLKCNLSHKTLLFVSELVQFNHQLQICFNRFHQLRRVMAFLFAFWAN